VDGMSRGEKTRIFWLGLVISGAAIVVLFSVFWSMSMLYPPSYPASYSWRYSTPFIFAGMVFLLIGLYMMMSGLPKEETKTA